MRWSGWALFAVPFLGTCDERAAGTLSEMLAKIRAGEFDDNFFDGEVFLEQPEAGKEAAAGCILDKVDAIVKENGVADFVNDLQVD
mmetsp:Transcript_2389/g.2726  ORF Transcript_2389/g.2726 Transcript_2389/m.2726 type:complete len:86 (-) Transcript_2389:5-262(-)